MERILDRIEKIAKNEGIRITTLERAIGASKGVLSRAISNGTDIQAKWIQEIVENYPSYSEAWLLTGKGEMLKSEPEAATPYIYKDASPPMGAPPPEQQPTANSELIEKICQLSAENALLRRDVEVLRNENEDLKNNRPKPASVPYDFDRPPAPSLVAEPEEAEYK